MDVREKLVELLKEAKKKYKHISNFNAGITNKNPEEFVIELIANHLITHGVTVQEFGHWVYDFNLAGSNFYRCSVCDRQETLLEKEDIYEYCPFCHCGAKMMPQPPKGE